MKRFLSLCLAAALCLALAGCASSEKQELKAALDEANGYTTVDYTMDDGTTLEQTVIYDKNGIVVTALGVKGDADSGRLWLRMENSTSDEVTLWTDSVQVNGWEMDSILWMKVSKNSMGREYVSFYPEDAGLDLDSIQTITLDCELQDGDYNTIDTFTATLETSAYTGQLADEELSEDVLYEGNGVTLTFGGVKQGRYSSYGKLQFYVENTGSKSVTLEGEMFQLSGGQELEVSLYETVSAGAKKAFYVYIDQDDIYDPRTDAYEYFDEYDGETFDWTAFMPFTMKLAVYEGYSTVLASATITIATNDVELVDEDKAADWVDESNIDGDTDIAIAEEDPRRGRGSQCHGRHGHHRHGGDHRCRRRRGRNCHNSDGGCANCLKNTVEKNHFLSTDSPLYIESRLVGCYTKYYLEDRPKSRRIPAAFLT